MQKRVSIIHGIRTKKLNNTNFGSYVNFIIGQKSGFLFDCQRNSRSINQLYLKLCLNPLEQRQLGPNSEESALKQVMPNDKDGMSKRRWIDPGTTDTRRLNP